MNNLGHLRLNARLTQSQLKTIELHHEIAQQSLFLKELVVSTCWSPETRCSTTPHCFKDAVFEVLHHFEKADNIIAIPHGEKN